jgi:esterase/lipase
LGRVSAPALVVQADADPTVDPISAKLLIKRLGSECKMLARLPFDRHVIVRDAGSEEVFRRVSRFVTQIAGNGHPR